MSKEMDEIRKKIARIECAFQLLGHHVHLGNKIADQILSLETLTCRIAVVRKEGELPDEILIGVLESLYDGLDADKDLAEVKAIGYVLDMLKAGFVQEVKDAQ